MNNNLLINYLKRNRDYCFSVGQYEFPKMLETNKGLDIDLEDNREASLLQGSKWSPNFREALDSEFPGVIYLREFPLLVRNMKAWKQYCLNHSVTDPDKLGRNYFLADYFFLDYNLIVEIDSNIHDEWYDSARDDYVNIVYGIHVMRLFEFGEPSTEVARIDDFGIALNRLKYSRPVNLDNSDLILSMFYKRNEDIIDALNIIEGVILSGNITNNTYTINLQLTPIKSLKDYQTIAKIIKGIYGVNVVMP